MIHPYIEILKDAKKASQRWPMEVVALCSLLDQHSKDAAEKRVKELLAKCVKGQ